MASDFQVNVIVVLIAILTVGMCVGMHYEGLNWLARRLAKQGHARRRRVLYGVVGALLLHIVEIWAFGVAYWICLAIPDAGDVTGASGSGLLEHVYLSAMTYSTVGFGDVAPHGAIRFIAGTEAVLGLFLIAWSATFTYYEMAQNWKDR